jgi:hypothetical protein
LPGYVDVLLGGSGDSHTALYASYSVLLLTARHVGRKSEVQQHGFHVSTIFHGREERQGPGRKSEPGFELGSGNRCSPSGAVPHTRPMVYLKNTCTRLPKPIESAGCAVPCKFFRAHLVLQNVRGVHLPAGTRAPRSVVSIFVEYYCDSC